MQIKNLLTGEIFTAHYSTDHPASSYNQPVIVLDETGEAVDLLGYEIIPEAVLSVYEVTGKRPEECTTPETWNTVSERIEAVTGDEAAAAFRERNPEHTHVLMPVRLSTVRGVNYAS